MSRYFLYSKNLWIGAFVLLFCASLLAFTSTVHAATNHPPIVESQPVTSATAGVAYEYELHATDRDNDTVEFSLTTSPEGVTIADGVVNWAPTKIGIYNFVIEITDGQNGYGSQAWQITVAAGPVEYIIVSPNDRPTIVPVDDNQQFSAEAYDEFNNVVSDVSFKWTTDETIGAVDTEGLFTARAGGIGFVAASVGDVINSIGVIGEETATDDETSSDTTVDEVEEDSVAVTVPVPETVVTEDTVDEDVNDNDATESTDDEDTVAYSSEDATNENENSDECTNWPHWVILILLVVYGGALIAYFQYEKKQKTGGWWIAPALLTAIGLVIYYKYVCAGTYVWWPWILLLIGVIITMNYKMRMKTPSGDSQNELPF